MPPEIRVAVADDHEVFRSALVHFLSTQAGFRVVGEAADGRQAIDVVLERDPDVIVLDLVMPGVDGIRAAQEIRRVCPRTEIVVLTGHHSEDYLRRAFEAGARAYLYKEGSLQNLLEGIRAASRGDYYLAGNAGRDLLEEYVRPAVSGQPAGGHVTPRERQLACLLADGYSTKEAAAVMDISVKTAETHRASLMRKLGARNLADVVKYCIRNHLIEV